MKNLFSWLISLCIFISGTVNATSEVSLHDKIGQMLLIGFDGKKINSQSSIGLNYRNGANATKAARF